MKKLSVLIVYPEMMVGGSTTSLLAFLNCIDKEKYEVDLQLYKNRGLLFDQIPDGINVLPEAFAYSGRIGGVIKKAKCVLTGALFKARKENKKIGKAGYSGQVMADFQAKHLSNRIKKHYDIAIGFMEGWADRYVAFRVKADKKIGWMHSTFKNLAEFPNLESAWMQQVDNIVFVADNCTEDFKKDMPDFSSKAITIRNIVDSSILRNRAELLDENDSEWLTFKQANCVKIVTVCRIDIKTKGLDRIVECVKHLKGKGRTFLWYIVGDGVELEKLKYTITSQGVDDCLIAIGNRMNPAPFIREADIFCMPSRYEGKPMVITESMILGTPPFVTRYLSASEQIENGVDGVIVDNEDDAMFEVLDRYIQDPSLINPIREYLMTREYGNSDYMREIEEKILNIGI